MERYFGMKSARHRGGVVSKTKSQKK